MKIKEIYEEVKSLVMLLQKKVASEEDTNLPETSKEYTKGQLYEASYILGQIEQIIFKD